MHLSAGDEGLHRAGEPELEHERPQRVPEHAGAVGETAPDRIQSTHCGWSLSQSGPGAVRAQAPPFRHKLTDIRAVTAGIVAGSLALTSFGFDSVIELVSATLVLGRLRAELSGGRASEQAERRVLRIIAVTFFVLTAYVVVASVIELAARTHPERSPAGIGLTISSLLVMPLLGWRKRSAGTALRNQLVLADAAETILCATLAATTLAGLVLFAAFGWWWADPVAALAVAWFAVREGREAWHGELACDD
jgi:hypothetical protein